MALPPGLDQFPSLLSADGMHSYVERHYGAVAGKIAGGTVVAAILLACIALIYVVLSKGIEIVSEAAPGSLPSVDFGNAGNLFVSLLAVAMGWIMLFKRISRIEGAVLEYAQTRIEPLLSDFNQRLDDAGSRIETLEGHTRPPGTLNHVLLEKELQRIKSDTLVIVSARYGCSARSVNVKKTIRAAVVNGGINMRVENDRFKVEIPPSGDPCPGVAKQLTVEFCVDNGTLQSITVDEHDRLQLPKLD